MGIKQSRIGRSFLSKEFKAIIVETEGEFIVGRTGFDLPEVDGEVLISTDKKLNKGDIVTVKITGAEDYDLYGELV